MLSSGRRRLLIHLQTRQVKHRVSLIPTTPQLTQQAESTCLACRVWESQATSKSREEQQLEFTRKTPAGVSKEKTGTDVIPHAAASTDKQVLPPLSSALVAVTSPLRSLQSPGAGSVAQANPAPTLACC